MKALVIVLLAGLGLFAITSLSLPQEWATLGGYLWGLSTMYIIFRSY